VELQSKAQSGLISTIRVKPFYLIVQDLRRETLSLKWRKLSQHTCLEAICCKRITISSKLFNKDIFYGQFLLHYFNNNCIFICVYTHIL